MTGENENDSPVALEVIAPSTVQALESAQIDCQIATAHKYPRSMEIFKKRALAMVQMDEETAESCIYVRPVGQEKNEKTGQWEQKFAEGPSIRLAEIVSTSYGNIRVAARIIEQTERYVKCEGVAHDLESNAAGKCEVMESTVTRDGKPYSERQRALIAKVCISKAYRDACFRIVPRALCKPLLEAAKKIMKGDGKPIAERVKRVQAWLFTRKIDEARVFAAFNIKGWADVTPDMLATFTGLKTSISEGDVTPDEAFPPLTGAQDTKRTPEQSGPKTTSSAEAKTSSQAATSVPTGPKTGNGDAAAAKKSPTGGAQGSAESATVPGSAAAEPPKTAQNTSDGSKTPPNTSNAAPTGSGAQGEPGKEQAGSKEQGQKTDEEAESDAGLAPAAEKPASDRAPYQSKSNISDEANNLYFLCYQAEVTPEALLTALASKKMARADQKIEELAGAKLITIAKNFDKIWLPAIKAASTPAQ